MSHQFLLLGAGASGVHLGPAVPALTTTPLYDFDLSRGVNFGAQGVQLLLDQVGKTIILTAPTAPDEPLYLPTEFGGKPGMHLTAGRFMSQNIPVEAAPYSVAMIYKEWLPDAVDNSRPFVAGGSSLNKSTGAGGLGFFFNGGASGFVLEPSAASEAHLMMATVPAVTGTILYFDAIAGAAGGAAGGAWGAPLQIGHDGGTQTDLKVARLVVQTGLFSAQDLADLRAWAKIFYGTA
jgi:hypothetical protein